MGYSLSKVSSKFFKLISFYLGYELLTDLILNPASKFVFGSDFFAAYIFTFIEFIIFLLIFHSMMKKKYKNVLVITFSIIFLAVFTIENILWKNNNFDSLTVGTSYILLIISAIICIGEELKQSKPNYIFTPKFLIITSSLIYFSGTLFIYILSKSYYSNSDFNKYYYLINPSIISLRNILFILSLIRLSNYNKKHLSIA